MSVVLPSFFPPLLSNASAFGTAADGTVLFLLGTGGVQAAFLDLKATLVVCLVIPLCLLSFRLFVEARYLGHGHCLPSLQ